MLLRLMLFNNDLAVVTDTIDRWLELPKNAHRRNAASLYFVRILLGQLYEGMLIVQEIHDSPRLLEAVEKSGRISKEAFEDVSNYWSVKAHRDYLIKLRNCAAFHYNAKLPARAVQEIEKRAPGRVWSYSMGHRAIDWRFELGEEVMAWIVIKHSYGREEGPSLERTRIVEEIASEQQRISRQFTAFAAHFVRHYSK